MLQVHNSKVEKIRTGFKEKYEQRQAAKSDPTQIEDESSLMETTNDAPQLKKKKTLVAKKKKDVGVEIKVKGEHGDVISYHEEEEEQEKKKTKKKSKIQSEETLEMLLNALKPQSAARKVRQSEPELKQEEQPL